MERQEMLASPPQKLVEVTGPQGGVTLQPEEPGLQVEQPVNLKGNLLKTLNMYNATNNTNLSPENDPLLKDIFDDEIVDEIEYDFALRNLLQSKLPDDAKFGTVKNAWKDGKLITVQQRGNVVVDMATGKEVKDFVLAGEKSGNVKKNGEKEITPDEIEKKKFDAIDKFLKRDEPTKVFIRDGEYFKVNKIGTEIKLADKKAYDKIKGRNKFIGSQNKYLEKQVLKYGGGIPTTDDVINDYGNFNKYKRP